MVKKYLLALVAIAAPSIVFSASNKDDAHELIVNSVDVGTFAGRCSTFSKMYEFQSKKKIPNGDEFIDKFIMSEASSEGWNIKEYTKACMESINTVNELKKTKPQGK